MKAFGIKLSPTSSITSTSSRDSKTSGQSGWWDKSFSRLIKRTPSQTSDFEYVGGIDYVPPKPAFFISQVQAPMAVVNIYGTTYTVPAVLKSCVDHIYAGSPELCHGMVESYYCWRTDAAPLCKAHAPGYEGCGAHLAMKLTPERELRDFFRLYANGCKDQALFSARDIDQAFRRCVLPSLLSPTKWSGGCTRDPNTELSPQEEYQVAFAHKLLADLPPFYKSLLLYLFKLFSWLDENRDETEITSVTLGKKYGASYFCSSAFGPLVFMWMIDHWSFIAKEFEKEAAECDQNKTGSLQE